MTVRQEEVTTAIGVARSVARADDAEAAEATVRLARLAGPEAVRLLRHIVRDDGVSIFQRTRAACTILEVGRFLGGPSSPETRSTAALRGPPTDGPPGRNEA
jgi:hypothetical protein